MVCGNSAALAAYEREESEYAERYEQALGQAQDELGPKFGKFDQLVLQLKGLEESFSRLASYSGPSDHLHELCSDMGGGLADLLHDFGTELARACPEAKGPNLQARLDSFWESECERYAEKLIENGDF